MSEHMVLLIIGTGIFIFCLGWYGGYLLGHFEGTLKGHSNGYAECQDEFAEMVEELHQKLAAEVTKQ